MGTEIPLLRISRYPTPPPAFANLSLLPSPWRERNEQVLFRGHAQLPPASLITFEHATIYGMGNIATSAGAILQAEGATAQREERRASVPFLDIHAALLRNPGDSNFGHWIVEILPRGREFKTHLNKTVPFLIPQSPFSMQTLRLRTLQLLEIGSTEIIFVDVNPKIIRELSYITSNSIHSHTHDHEGVREVVAQLKRRPTCAGRARRLFVLRKPGLRRQLLNQQQILQIAENAGFEHVFPEDLSIDEQIGLFSTADMIAGVSGAGLTNLVWAPPHCRIVSLHPNTGHEFFFWDLANIMGMEYSMIFGPSADQAKLGHSDFSVDPLLFQHWLDG